MKARFALTAVLVLFAAPVNAKIVYTPSHAMCTSGPCSFPINPTDGKEPDFTIHQAQGFYVCPSGTADNVYAAVRVNPARASGAGDGATTGWAAALERGTIIDSHLPFDEGRPLLTQLQTGPCNAFTNGYWLGQGVRYLGLRFRIGRTVHYGWAALSVTFSSQIITEMTGYAYETVAGKSIRAGQIRD